ncbi:MAG: hypothetical protein PHY15_05455 [Eubacteriales bacterium]|nr:hypothetical protein [Eubacteriales bacterium]MDD4475245.1 hypothetical protein [Eubacteriales bacterium]
MKRSKKIILFSAALALALAAELFLFNSSFFISKLPGMKTETVALADMTFSPTVQLLTEDGEIKSAKIAAKSSVSFFAPESGARYIKIVGEGGSKKTELTIHKNGKKLGRYFYAYKDPDSLVFAVHAKKDDKIEIIFEDGASGFQLTEIVLNAGRSFYFNALRFLFFAVSLCGIAVVFAYRLIGKVFDHRKRLHNFAIIALFLYLTSFSFTLAGLGIYGGGNGLPHEYPLKGDINRISPYIQQTDAFIKGQLNLDIEVPEEMLEVENPYNPDNIKPGWRIKLWDRSFYEGKVYSYYGVAPVVLVYLPFYFFTGTIASDAIACFVFALDAVAFILLLIREIVIYYNLKLKLLTLLGGMTAAVFGGMVFLLQSSSNFYTVPVISGLCFLFGFLYLGFRASRCSRYPLRYILFALCGLCFGLIVASRPSIVFYLVAMLPIFVALLFDKAQPLSKRLYCAASFASVVILCGAAIMWYNAARFSSPFDFGVKYQITVSDITKNTVDFSYFGLSIFHFFLQTPVFKDSFPFITISHFNLLGPADRWFYISVNVGAFMFPVTLAACFSPARLSKKKPDRGLFYVIMVAVAFVVAFLDFCLAGAHVRYTADVTPMLALVGVMVLLELTATKFGKVFRVVSWVLFASTIIVSVFLSFNSEIIANLPEVYSRFANPMVW